MMESTHGAANPFASATEPPDEAEPTAAGDKVMGSSTSGVLAIRHI